MGRRALRSEGTALGSPTSKEAELHGGGDREKLVCPPQGHSGQSESLRLTGRNQDHELKEAAGVFVATVGGWGSGLSADRRS